MSEYDPVLIDMVRRTMPAMIAKDIADVQPMQEDVLSNLMKMEKMAPHSPMNGSIWHSFTEGWGVYYRGHFVTFGTYYHIMMNGL